MGVSVEYVAKETATNLWRNRMMALAAVLTVAVSLSLVGTALLLNQAAKRQLGQWANNVSLQVFVNAGATTAQHANIKSVIKQTPQIKSCSYLGPKQSLAGQVREVLSGSPTALSTLTLADIPPVYDCQLTTPSAAQTVADEFSSVPGVYRAQYPQQSIRVFQRLSSVLQLILLIIAIVLLASTLVLILNAIRMAIFTRRREVSVMKLVAATNWFIRVPFMMEGLVQGLLGACVAVVIVILANLGVSYVVDHYGVHLLAGSVLPLHQLVATEAIVVVLGLLIGVAGSLVAVRRFLDV